jgi:DNA-directed RNA polymerase specialized sigma24 family protein
MPSSEGSITQLISRLKEGNPTAAEQLWVRFHERLIQLAVARMQELPKRMADEDDVVAAALAGCLQAIQEGRYPRLASREDFWLLLVRSTEHQMVDLRRREMAAKRGGGMVRGESGFLDNGRKSAEAAIEQVVGHGPSPEFVALAADQLDHWFRQLEPYDDALRTLRRIAVFKLEGYTNAEAAVRLELPKRTLERKLHLIRTIWFQEAKAWISTTS